MRERKLPPVCGTLEDGHSYLINADAGVRTDLTKTLFLEAKVEWVFNSDPAPGKEQNDVRYIFDRGLMLVHHLLHVAGRVRRLRRVTRHPADDHRHRRRHSLLCGLWIDAEFLTDLRDLGLAERLLDCL